MGGPGQLLLSNIPYSWARIEHLRVCLLLETNTMTLLFVKSFQSECQIIIIGINLLQ